MFMYLIPPGRDQITSKQAEVTGGGILRNFSISHHHFRFHYDCRAPDPSFVCIEMVKCH